MNPKLYEGLGAQHLADLHREAGGSHWLPEPVMTVRSARRAPPGGCTAAFDVLGRRPVRVLRLRVRD